MNKKSNPFLFVFVVFTALVITFSFLAIPTTTLAKESPKKTGIEKVQEKSKDCTESEKKAEECREEEEYVPGEIAGLVILMIFAIAALITIPVLLASGF